MSEEYQILVQINANVEKAVSALGRVTTEMGKTQQKTDSTAKSFNAFQEAGSVAAGMLIRDMTNGLSKVATESLELGAEVQSLRSGFDSMKRSLGANELSLKDLQTATKNTVSDVDLLAAANKAMSLGLPTENLGELMTAAMKLGRVMGIDTTSAVDSLTTGIGRQSAMILDNLGVTFKAEEAYVAYAEKIGVTTAELDENQKKLAWQEYAMQMVIERSNELGDVQDDMITQQEQMTAAQTNLNTSIGEALSPLGFMKEYIDDVIKVGTTVAMTVIPKWIEAHGGLQESIGFVGGKLSSFIHMDFSTLTTNLDKVQTKLAGLSSVAQAGIVIGVVFAVSYVLSQIQKWSEEEVTKSLKQAGIDLERMPELSTIYMPSQRGGIGAKNFGLGGLLPGKQGGGFVGLSGPEIVKVGEAGPEFVVPNHELGQGLGNKVVQTVYDVKIYVNAVGSNFVESKIAQALKSVIIKESSSGAPAEQKTIELSQTALASTGMVSSGVQTVSASSLKAMKVW